MDLYNLKHFHYKSIAERELIISAHIDADKEKDKQISELQAEVERLSDLCFKKESELMNLKDLIPIKNKIKRVII